MKKYLIFLFFLIPQMTYSQHYVNKIIPTTFGNINATNIYLFNGQYLVQGIFGNNQSCIFDISQDLSLSQHYIYDSTVFSRAPFNIIDNKIFAFSKNRFLSKGLQILDFNKELYLNQKFGVSSQGEFNFPLSSISLGRNVFATYIFETGNIRKFGIFNIKPDGTIKWNKVYDNNLKYATLWDLDSRNGNYILGSYNVTYTNDFNSSVRVIKIDTSGQEIWKSDTLRGVNDNDDPVWMTELSDSNIFLTYKVNKFFDPEFFDLHPYPPTFIWLDKNGKKIKEHVIRMDRKHDIYISEIEAGKGDYFFVYGQVSSRVDQTNNLHGFITKYANNGDTIWTHTYRHPSFNKEDYFHYVNDLIEEDNGDLTVLGSLAPIGGKNEVWVFRVNSEGCFGTDSCDQFTLADHDVIQPEPSEIKCFPNPTTGKVTLSGLPLNETYNIRIYSIDGRLIVSNKERNPSELDLSHMNAGIYFIEITGEKANTTLKLIKI